MIKKIYAFGTSHTAGGGFEFNKSDGSPNPIIYKKIVNSENHFDFSYPNILGRFTNIQVINHAKQGYGYQRATRKIFETVTDINFNKEESLLLIECSNIDRHEYFYKPLNDYICMNVNPAKIKGPKNFPVAKDWNYQTEEDIEILNKNMPNIFGFFNDSVEFNDVLQKNQINLLFMLNFLENNNINYYLTNGDGELPMNEFHRSYIPFLNNRSIKYKFYNFAKDKYSDVFCFTGISEQFKLNIVDESNGLIKDDHQGYSVSEHIACTIYNRMIDDGYINGEYKESDLKSKFLETKEILSSL